jgi:REP element-mobilizing transposase RayT
MKIMARPLRIQLPGAFHHITSRGNERSPVFLSQRDREKFLSYLESASERYKAVIHVYCLMDNHYHLLLETPAGNLSQIMHHINGAYTTFFNTKRSRSGHLFQGRYKAILIEVDEYAKELSRYIHLNPVRAGMVGKPEEYEWSSYRHYTVERNAPEWLERNFILGYFSKKLLRAMKLYCEFVDSSIDHEYKNPLADISNSVILGSKEFIAEIKDRFLGDQKSDRDLPALRNLSTSKSFDDIEEAVDSAFPSDKKLARQVKLYFCHRYSGRKLKEIGSRFGIGLSGVTRASNRISLKAEKDKKIGKILKRIEKNIVLSNA